MYSFASLDNVGHHKLACMIALAVTFAEKQPPGTQECAWKRTSKYSACHKNSQSSIFSSMIKLVGNDTTILRVFWLVSLSNLAHLFRHHIGSHVLYGGFSPFRCNKRHLLESDSLTSTLSNVFVHALVHGRPVDPHLYDSI